MRWGFRGVHRLVRWRTTPALVVTIAVGLGAAIPFISYFALPPSFSGSASEVFRPRPTTSPSPYGSVAPQPTRSRSAPPSPSGGQPQWPTYIPTADEKGAAVAAANQFRGYAYRYGFQ